MGITPFDLTGIDEDLARRVIGVGRSIAPCIDCLGPGEDFDTAVAILRGVATEAAGRGSRLVQSQRIGPAAVTYTNAESWFAPDDRAALRALCRAPIAGGPVGHFPKARPLAKVWPEGEY